MHPWWDRRGQGTEDRSEGGGDEGMLGRKGRVPTVRKRGWVRAET